MSYDVIENPVTGERMVVRMPAAQSPDGLFAADFYARPGAAVVGEHTHPYMTETFTVIRGRIGMRIDGRVGEVGPGTRTAVPPGTRHDWWNAGPEPAWAVVEVAPGARFEKMLRNLFFLAADGKTDRLGRPKLLQLALLAREFDDTARLTRPPRAVQRILFAALAPVARWRRYRGSYPAYDVRVSGTVDELEPLPADIARLLPRQLTASGAQGTLRR